MAVADVDAEIEAVVEGELVVVERGAQCTLVTVHVRSDVRPLPHLSEQSESIAAVAGPGGIESYVVAHLPADADIDGVAVVEAGRKGAALVLVGEGAVGPGQRVGDVSGDATYSLLHLEVEPLGGAASLAETGVPHLQRRTQVVLVAIVEQVVHPLVIPFDGE